jgi:hypothetical protein
MSRLWPEGTPIGVRVDGQGRPTAFVWQGRTHQVAHLRQQWLVDTDWWSEAGRIWRAYAVMTTDTGLLCVVYQDLISEAWFLAKVYD